jgi:hypothetical protein
MWAVSIWWAHVCAYGERLTCPLITALWPLITLLIISLPDTFVRSPAFPHFARRPHGHVRLLIRLDWNFIFLSLSHRRSHTRQWPFPRFRTTANLKHSDRLPLFEFSFFTHTHTLCSFDINCLPGGVYYHHSMCGMCLILCLFFSKNKTKQNALLLPATSHVSC